MFTRAVITAAIFGLGWLCGYGTILSRDGEPFTRTLRVALGAGALFFYMVAFCFITSSGFGLLLAEFCVLNLGLSAYQSLYGKPKRLC
jgi:hypothetical protein